MTSDSHTSSPTRVLLLSSVVAVLAAAFWLLTNSSVLAAPGTCQVCHKRATTLTFNCLETEYFRHLDHGDPMGACPATTGAREPKDGARAK